MEAVGAAPAIIPPCILERMAGAAVGEGGAAPEAPDHKDITVEMGLWEMSSKAVAVEQVRLEGMLAMVMVKVTAALGWLPI